MGKSKYIHSIAVCKINDLPSVLAGESTEYQLPLLKTHWRQKRGMECSTGVTFNSNANPIISGKLDGFMIPDIPRFIGKVTST